MKRLWSSALALIVVATGLSMPVSAQAAVFVDKTYVEGTDTQAFLFNPLTVNQIDITMTPAAEAALRADLRVYQPATIKLTTALGATSTYAVGVHVKGGWGSFRSLDEKAAFKVKVNYSVPGQTIYGVKKFTLNNMVQDASMLHEAVSYRLFRALGVAAPRVGYANVSFNGANFGLHSNIETYDKPMLKRWFPGGTDLLYEGAYGVEVGPDLEVDEGSTTDRSEVTQLRDWNNTLSGKAWFDTIRTKVDLNQMIMNWAVEHYIGHWDGYTRGWPNNYYLHKPTGGLFTMHPWGTDQTWGWDGPLMDDGATMMGRCIQYQPCQDLYLKALAEIQAKVPTLGLVAMVDKIWTNISPSVQLDPRKPYGYWDSENSKNATKTFIDYRFQALVNNNGTRQIGSLSASYAKTGFKVRATVKPKVTRSGDGTVTFSRIQGVGVCEVDPNTGAVLILNSGVCQVAAQTSKTNGFHASMVSTTLNIPKLASRILVPVYPALRYGKSQTISAVTESTGALSVRLKSGRCRVTGKTIRALASSGKCLITLSVAGDANYLKASGVLTINLRK
ncbi:MAG: hypothetical protein F2529_01615 [Actinobacteria bacterium]|nr:hypothetical protein [Actinomycetota bacterium]